VLLVALVLGSTVRLWGIGAQPPGLGQDEAVTAWNAWCLLKTGQDSAGVHWPIFYSRCTGANHSTLYIYLLLPFEMLGGMNVVTARLPSVVAGIACIPLIYYLGRRLFGRPAGALAALLLATNPWMEHTSRWGHEANICPLLAMVPLALMLWTGFWREGAAATPAAAPTDAPRPLRALAAGLLSGVCCYGYPAVRLFIPAMLLLAVALTWRQWRDLLRRRPAGALSVAAFILGLALTFGPLVYVHLTDSRINRRGTTQFLWNQPKYKSHLAANLAWRYVAHFDPRNLFRQVLPPSISRMGGGFGWFHPYGLVLMAAGLVWMLRRRSHLGVPILLAGLLAYPLGDCLGITDAGIPHPLRSSPGAGYLVLIEAVGAVALLAWAVRRSRAVRLGAGAVSAAVVVASNALLIHALLVSYNRDVAVSRDTNADLRQAAEWMRTMTPPPDAVFISAAQPAHLPYLLMLVHLRYDPVRWFAEPKDFVPFLEFDACRKFGKYNFYYGLEFQAEFDRLVRSGRRNTVLFVVSPQDYPALNSTFHVTRLLEVRDPAGTITMVLAATVLNPEGVPQAPRAQTAR
jgi:4-amino-4-deoxy-L-arabinose transferase-like glycosyltransferase